MHLSALLYFWLQLVEANPPLPLMLTHAGTDSALLAPCALPPVLTDAAASALHAQMALLPVFTDAAASALLAQTALPPVLTDAAASALLAITALPPVLAEWTWHVESALSSK